MDSSAKKETKSMITNSKSRCSLLQKIIQRRADKRTRKSEKANFFKDILSEYSLLENIYNLNQMDQRRNTNFCCGLYSALMYSPYYSAIYRQHTIGCPVHSTRANPLNQAGPSNTLTMSTMNQDRYSLFSCSSSNCCSLFHYNSSHARINYDEIIEDVHDALKIFRSQNFQPMIDRMRMEEHCTLPNGQVLVHNNNNLATNNNITEDNTGAFSRSTEDLLARSDRRLQEINAQVESLLEHSYHNLIRQSPILRNILENGLSPSSSSSPSSSPSTSTSPSPPQSPSRSPSMLSTDLSFPTSYPMTTNSESHECQSSSSNVSTNSSSLMNSNSEIKAVCESKDAVLDAASTMSSVCPPLTPKSNSLKNPMNYRREEAFENKIANIKFKLSYIDNAFFI